MDVKLKIPIHVDVKNVIMDSLINTFFVVIIRKKIATLKVIQNQKIVLNKIPIHVDV